MSISIGYRPHNPKGLTRVGGTSDFWRILEDNYGSKPILRLNDIEFLKGVSACGHNCAQELIDAIYEFDVIEVEASY